MKIYKNTIICTAILTVISLIGMFAIDSAVWLNIVQSILTGALLTLMTSCVGYFVERTRVAETLYINTKSVLRKITSYNRFWSRDQKVEYFLNLRNDYPVEWDNLFGELAFFAKKKEKQREIFERIYSPIHKVYSFAEKENHIFKDYTKYKNNPKFCKDVIDKKIELFERTCIVCESGDILAFEVQGFLDDKYFDICGLEKAKIDDK